jgi:hypothetical protein
VKTSHTSQLARAVKHNVATADADHPMVESPSAPTAAAAADVTVNAIVTVRCDRVGGVSARPMQPHDDTAPPERSATTRKTEKAA